MAAAALLFGGLLVLCVSALVAGASTLLMAAAFAIRASTDLFGAWRQTTLLPEMLVLGTVVLLMIRKGMERWAGSSGQEARWLAAAALFTMAFRLALIFHPDFYSEVYIRMTRGQGSLVIDSHDSGGPQLEVAAIDLSAFALPVLAATDDELAAHEFVLKDLDKASNGKTLWRTTTV